MHKNSGDNKGPEFSGFKQKRQDFSSQIRKEKRQEAFKRKRLMHDHQSAIQQESEHASSHLQSKHNFEQFIVDQQLRDLLIELNSREYSESLMDLIKDVFSQDIKTIHKGMIGIRKVLSVMKDPPIQKCIDLGMVPRLIQLINQTKHVQLKFQAAWALSSVAASSPPQICKVLYEKGALKSFVELAKHENRKIQDQAIWGLGNLAVDSLKYRDEIIKLGGFNILIALVRQSKSKKTIKNGCWAISNLSRGFPPPQFNLIKQAIPIIGKSVSQGYIDDNCSILADCYWTIAYMTQSNKKAHLNYLIENCPIDIFFRHVRLNQFQVSIAALRIIGNLSQGGKSHLQILLDKGFLHLCTDFLLKHQKKQIRKQACWILSNLCGGCCEQVHMILENGLLIDHIIHIFKTDTPQIRKECCWIFANMCHLGERQLVLQLLYQKEIILYFTFLMEEDNADILDHMLCCLDKLLEFGQKYRVDGVNVLLKALEAYEGYKKLEQLQHHPLQAIYKRSATICQKYSEAARENAMDEEF